MAGKDSSLAQAARGRSRLAAGELLPSVREVAGFHAINPMTVSRAYGLAESEGLLERLRGKGMAVAATRRASQTENQRLALLEPQMLELARHARELELPAEPVLRRLTKLLGGIEMPAIRLDAHFFSSSCAQEKLEHAADTRQGER